MAVFGSSHIKEPDSPLTKLKNWLIYGKTTEPEYVREVEGIEDEDGEYETPKLVQLVAKDIKERWKNPPDWDFVSGEFEIVGEGENAHAEYDEPDPVKEIGNAAVKLQNVEKKTRMLVHEIATGGALSHATEATVENPNDKEREKEEKKKKLEIVGIVVGGIVILGIIYYIWR